MIEQSVLSTKDVQVPVMPGPVNGSPYNPTGDAVFLAFMASPPAADPGAGDWHPGTWDVPAVGVYLAQCLVGPDNGGVALGRGDYVIWARVVDNPEIPTEAVDLLRIT